MDGLVRGIPDLDAMFRSLDYDLNRETKIHDGIARLESLIVVTVPDLPSLRAALQESTARMAAAGLPPSELTAELTRPGLQDQDLLRLLNRSPLTEQIPYIESIPIGRDGEWSWRSPVTLAIIRKRPQDTLIFQTALAELRNLVLKGDPRIGLELRAKLTVAFDAVARTCAHPDGYLPTALGSLKASIRNYLDNAPSELNRHRRNLALTVLLNLTRVNRFYELAATSPVPASEATCDEVDAHTIAVATTIVENRWLQNPWLIRSSLSTLIDGLLRANGALPAHSVQVLTAMRDELATGQYDDVENIRRLRELEHDGTLINSLAYALLRIHGTRLDGSADFATSFSPSPVPRQR